MQLDAGERPYIDVHRHCQDDPDENVVSICNVYYQDAARLMNADFYSSVGLHPWHTTFVEINEDELIQKATSPQVLSIGEIGLDRLKGATLTEQIDQFLLQVRVADRINKPVIIHCVKSWDELIQVKNIVRPKVPWIIHGFRGNTELARQMIGQGFYLSFGDAILHESNRTREALHDSQIDRIFLETDESNLPISAIYQEASLIKNITVNECRLLLADNFERIFGVYV